MASRRTTTLLAICLSTFASKSLRYCFSRARSRETDSFNCSRVFVVRTSNSFMYSFKSLSSRWRRWSTSLTTAFMRSSFTTCGREMVSSNTRRWRSKAFDLDWLSFIQSFSR